MTAAAIALALILAQLLGALACGAAERADGRCDTHRRAPRPQHPEPAE